MPDHGLISMPYHNGINDAQLINRFDYTGPAYLRQCQANIVRVGPPAHPSICFAVLDDESAHWRDPPES